MRAYLTGSSPTSIWTAYARGERQYCGHRLPDGLQQHQRLPVPLITPTTKALKGEHDALVGVDEVVSRGLVGPDQWEQLQTLALAMFAFGSKNSPPARPDLGRYQVRVWPARGRCVGFCRRNSYARFIALLVPGDGYEESSRAGQHPQALDKEFVRRWLAQHGYMGEGAPPTLPARVRVEAAKRYIEIYERLTGRTFHPATDPPQTRLKRCFGALIS